MSAFQNLAPVFALAALTAVATPEIANAQSYPGGAVIIQGGQNYGYEREYFGTPMTMAAAQEVKARGPVDILPFANTGYTEATFPDGQHIGVRFTLHDNGFATVAQTYDLNKRSDVLSWDSNRNYMAQIDDANGQRYAGAYSGPSIFRPCIQGPRGVEIIVGVGMPNVIFAGPRNVGYGGRHHGHGGGAGGAVILSAPIGNGTSITVVAPIGGGRPDHNRGVFNGGGYRHGGGNIVISPQIVIGGGDRHDRDGGHRHHRR